MNWLPWISPALLLTTAALALAAPSPVSPVSPIEANGFGKVSSHAQLRRFLDQLTGASKRFEIRSLGRSRNGFDIPEVHMLPIPGGEKTKVLIFCQQHGNEPSGKEAALLLLGKIAAGMEDSLLTHLDLHIIPCVNPDGNEVNARRNGTGADLNRDHLLLSQPETQALHQAYREISPEVTVDVHEYQPYHKSWIDAGLARLMDEQFGAPTNLNVPAMLPEHALGRLFPHLSQTLSKQGIRFFNYCLIDTFGETARHSTTNINDGRQGFAIQGSYSFIIEGRNARDTTAEMGRRTRQQLAALEAFLGFVNGHAAEIRTLVGAAREQLVHGPETIVTRMDYAKNGTLLKVPVASIASGAATEIEVQYAPTVRALRSVDMAEAYVIPAKRPELRAFLERHGVAFTLVGKPERRKVEIYSIRSEKSITLEGKTIHDLETVCRRAEVELTPGDAIVSLAQRQGMLLATAFEPSSMWGLAQYDEFAFLRSSATDYPILRIPRQH